MPLVVALRNMNGVIHVSGDMRLTDPDELRRGYPYGVLKNIILSPEHLVAYAGNAELAMHTIRNLRNASLEELVAGLHASAEQAGDGLGAVDFLIAHTAVGLRRVTARGIEEPSDAGWLGDAAAFEIYQQAYHNAARP